MTVTTVHYIWRKDDGNDIPLYETEGQRVPEHREQVSFTHDDEQFTVVEKHYKVKENHTVVYLRESFENTDDVFNEEEQ